MLKRGDKQVQRLSGATREDNLPRLLGVDEIGYRLTGMLVGLRRLLAQIMHPSMNVAILMQVIITLAIDDT